MDKMNYKVVMLWWMRPIFVLRLLFAQILALWSAPLRPVWLACVLIGSLLLGTMVGSSPVLAQQAAGTGKVAVVKVDDQNFPVVSLSLDVADANGAPVAGLAPANFSIEQDGQPATVKTVAVDSSQPVALLLALDRSTDATTWAAVQGAAAAVINALGPQDQVAITTIFEQVQTVSEFTADKNAALSALAGVTPGGQFSAVNPAFIDAIGHFNDNLPQRRAVVLVADAPDNTSTVTANDVIAQVSGHGTPIYVVGYGARVQNEPSFSQIATSTGGRFFAINAANDLQNTLTALLPQLRQGYRVDFTSTIKADNAPHTAQVAVSGPNVNNVATGQFVARPSTINVSLPGLTAGQPVAGVINLTAAASLSGTVAAADYQVDGVSIGKEPNLTTPVVWDTTSLAPGPHQLSVVVTDTVGNQGQATVPIVIPQSSARLDLLNVESTAFPKVSTFVDAFGANGLPLSGLSSQSFTVTEDSQALDPSKVAVAVDASQPLNLVLVLDRSVPAADWAQLRNGANNLINSLRPQDQMAIYAFADAPTLVQTLSGDKNTLRSALASVEAVAPPKAAAGAVAPATLSADNALHQALLDATNLAGTLPPGRRAVVAVTNGVDNSGQIALTDLISTLQAQPVPVHVLAYGVDGQSAGTLAAIAQMAGGNSVAVNNAGEIRSALQQLILLLQQGYRLDFTSAIKSDNQPHNLAIGLAAAGLQAQAAGQFIATGHPISVTFPNVKDGATVSGAMNLTAKADAPAPITSVNYTLNGKPLAQVADTTFSIVWNSDTVDPGAYTVVAEVTDAAGNQGSGTVGFTVVAPVTVTAALDAGHSDGPIKLGDKVMVSANATTFSGKPTVEFYVDDTLVNTDRSSPFSYSIDTAKIGAGDHKISVIAKDDANHQAISDDINVTFVAPPAPTPRPAATSVSLIPTVTLPKIPTLDWWRIIRWASIFLIALIALWAVFSARGSAKRNAIEQKLVPMRMTLSNLGNVATGYLLRGDDPAGILSFRFSLNGVALGLPPVARLTNDAPAGQGTTAARPAFGGFQLPKLPQSSGDHGEAGENGGESGVTGAFDKLEEASEVSSVIVSILGSVASVLPRSLAQPIRLVTSQISNGQRLASRAKTIRRNVDRLNKTEMGRQVVDSTSAAATQVGQVATSDATRAAVAQGATRTGAMVATAAAGSSLYNLSGQGTATAQTRPAGNGANGTGAAGGRQWVYLPTLNPGDTVTIDVMVGASGRNASGDHQPFRILSRAMADESAQPVVEEGSIRVAKSSPWPSLLRFLIATLVVLVAVALIYWLVTTLF